MDATPHVSISIPSGLGTAADDVQFAALVRLLQRWGSSPLRAIVARPERSQLAHPGVQFVDAGEFAGTVATGSLLCIAGSLAGDAAIEDAARHVALAKLAGVPVALVAVRVAAPAGEFAHALLREIVAQAESVSAADAESAAHLAAACGHPVDTVAPLEFLLPPAASAPSPARRIGILAELLDDASAAEIAALNAALRALPALTPVVLGAPARAGAAPAPAWRREDPPDWRAWVAAIARCAVILAPDSSPALAAALGAGVAPVALLRGAEPARGHARLGLATLTGRWNDDATALRSLLERAAACAPADLRARTAAPRAVAWRALMPLAGALRAQPLHRPSLGAASRACVAAACATLAGPALARGDAPAAEKVLLPWGDVLATEPAWAVARAAALALAGCDREAIALLAHVIREHPDERPVQRALARACCRAGEFDAARAAWERLAAGDPGAEPWHELGMLELLRGDRPGALRAWSEAQRREPGRAVTTRAIDACLAGDAAAEIQFWESLARANAAEPFFQRMLAAAAERDGAQARTHGESAGGGVPPVAAPRPAAL